ncbi:hypothetical protein, partial [Rhodopirellula sp. MGV]|uniref:hypothetical protein n=1 Tax=Rhodopirellula sp. MGV TaxID=2023130 RepID=UPI000BCB9080
IYQHQDAGPPTLYMVANDSNISSDQSGPNQGVDQDDLRVGLAAGVCVAGGAVAAESVGGDPPKAKNSANAVVRSSSACGSHWTPKRRK